MPLQSAREVLKGFENLLVLPGDVPLIRPETIEQLWQFHQKEGAAMTILSATPQNPAGYGRVLRKAPGSAEVDVLVEQNMLKPAQESAGEIDSGIHAIKTAPLLAHLGKLTPSTPHGEVSLAQIAGLLRTAGERVAAVQVAEATEVLGANTIAELAALDAALRTATANRLMAAGVTIFRPDTCVIDADVEVEPDTVIEPFVQLLGNTRIGAECRIRSYTVIENCTLGNRIIIRQSCVLADSTIADGADIGPFARMRPGCEIGEDVHIGNFVEVKKSKLARGVKAGHLAYLGDSDIGAKTNIGAGVITCNYDGAHKHITRIGEGVFVGSDSTLVAPVTVEDGAYIGAGSCITQNVPADARPSRGPTRSTTKAGQPRGAPVKRQRAETRQERSGIVECKRTLSSVVLIRHTLLSATRIRGTLPVTSHLLRLSKVTPFLDLIVWYLCGKRLH